MKLSTDSKKKLKEITNYHNTKLNMPEEGFTDEQMLNFCVNLVHKIFITKEFNLQEKK
ncbi:hypothetical protein ACTHAL_002895 [Priestia flexa]|uniref:hypothetical protein n=1 Tax=Bacillaceae TaxID=186817 RepID=UPI000A6CA32E|nr:MULTISPECIES: hypothetical protein [Bacillaceae]WEZ10150.1 hypothetical protein P5663_10075 [Priestia flexa]